MTIHPASLQLVAALDELGYSLGDQLGDYEWLRDGGFDGGNIVRLSWMLENRTFLVRDDDEMTPEEIALEFLAGDEPVDVLYGELGARFEDVTLEVMESLENADYFEWENTSLFLELSKKIWDSSPDIQKLSNYQLGLLIYLLGRLLEMMEYTLSQAPPYRGKEVDLWHFKAVYAIALSFLSEGPDEDLIEQAREEFQKRNRPGSLALSAHSSDRFSSPALTSRFLDLADVMETAASTIMLEMLGTPQDKQHVIDLCYQTYQAYVHFYFYAREPSEDEFEEFQESLDNFLRVLLDFETSWLKVSYQSQKELLEESLFQNNPKRK